MPGDKSYATRAFTLMYHDVVRGGDFRSSGLALPGSDRYKLDAVAFDAHLGAILDRLKTKPGAVTTKESGIASYLTFDDGGVSAATLIAPKLDPLGWVGHFFITTDRIGTPGFVTAEDIRALHATGHVIGSHSCSHPRRFSHCSATEQRREWRESVAVLSEVIGTPVVTASVPGGFYDEEVARAADEVGIRYLFTSEPTTRVIRVGECQVMGRFAVIDTTSPKAAAALIAGESLATTRQAALWKVKGWAKRFGGRTYLRLRDRLLKSNDNSAP